MPLARVAPALVVGLLGAAAIGPRVDRDPDILPGADPLVDSRYRCATVGTRAWSPLPGLEFTGRLGVHVPAGEGSLVFVIGDAVPLDLVADTADGSPVLIRTERLRAGAFTQAPPAYWIEQGDPWSAPREIVRVTVDAFADRDRRFSLRLGRRAPRVIARVRDAPDAAHATLCAIPVAAPAFADTTTFELTAAAAPYFGTGWYGVERLATGAARWMRDRAAILIPFARRGRVTLRLSASFAIAGAASPGALALTVNDTFVAAPVPLQPGLGAYEWVVPEHAWVIGTNELLFGVPRTSRAAGDSRDLGLAMHRLELALTSTGLPGNDR
jgi:hypothetical protein